MIFAIKPCEDPVSLQECRPTADDHMIGRIGSFAKIEDEAVLLRILVDIGD